MNDGTIIASTVTFSQMMEPSHARRTEKIQGRPRPAYSLARAHLWMTAGLDDSS